MDPSSVQTTPSIEDDEWGIFAALTFWAVGLDGGASGFLFYLSVVLASFWADTEGYVIPSLELEDSGQNNSNLVEVEESKTVAAESKKEENIYLGPHGAPPSQSKQQELNSANNRKQKFRQKLKEADKKYSGSGRENKVEHLRELVGGKMAAGSKNSPKDWLDPHCDENMFQRNQR